MGFLGSSGSVGKITESDLPVTVKEKLIKVNEIGDLSELKTNNKSSLTAATNEVSAQLAENKTKVDFYEKDKLDTSAREIIISKLISPTSQVIDIDGKTVKGTNRRYVGLDLQNMNGYLLELGDGSIINNLYIKNSAKEGDYRQIAFHANAKAVFVGTNVIDQKPFRWGKISDCYIASLKTGLQLEKFSYATIDNCNIVACKTAIQLGKEGLTGWSGGLNINNNHIRENYVGLDGHGHLGTIFLVNNIFEYNRKHIQLKGTIIDFTMENGYLADSPEIAFDIDGCNRFYIKNVPISGGNGQYIASDLGKSYDDPTLPFYNNEYNKGVIIRNSKVILENVEITGQLDRVFGKEFYMVFFDIDANSSLTLKNVQDSFYLKNKMPVAGYHSRRLFPIVNYGYITDENSKENYIVNGLIKNTDYNNTFAKGSATTSPNKKNPWGGNVVRMPNGSYSLTYKIPKDKVGKKMALTVYAGEQYNQNTNYVSATGDITNDSTLSSDFITPGRKTPNGTWFAYTKSVFIVTPTKEQGKINFFSNKSDNTITESYIDIAAFILSDYDTYNKIFAVKDLEDTVNFGASMNRPITPKVGFDYFDTSLNKKITFDGTAWRDANGATV